MPTVAGLLWAFILLANLNLLLTIIDLFFLNCLESQQLTPISVKFRVFPSNYLVFSTARTYNMDIKHM